MLGGLVAGSEPLHVLLCDSQCLGNKSVIPVHANINTTRSNNRFSDNDSDRYNAMVESESKDQKPTIHHNENHDTTCRRNEELCKTTFLKCLYGD